MLIKCKYMKKNVILFLLIYMATVIWFTVLKRAPNYEAPRFEIFWSYRKWMSGDWAIGQQILGNMGMFFPLGFLLTAIMLSGNRRKFRGFAAASGVCVLAILFSLSIEFSQLLLNRGLFEWDDCVSNVTGALIGSGFYTVMRIWMPEKIFCRAEWIFEILFMVTCGAVLILSVIRRDYKAVNHSLSSFCFQIDDVTYDLSGRSMEIRGYAFQYERRREPFSLYLKSTGTGMEVELETTDGIAREDVNNYFDCEYDYHNAGFAATAAAGGESRSAEYSGDSPYVDPYEEYEVIIQWPWSGRLSTGVFVTGTTVHYVSRNGCGEPEKKGDLADIVEEGMLLIYRPDYHCWVYQLGKELYWVVDSEFEFDEDEKTLVQYQLWTTQPRKIPEERLEDGYFWDNLSGNFEDNELKGNFGSYRVMKMEIPMDYSVAYIITGRYKHGGWEWKNFFRPVYEELIQDRYRERRAARFERACPVSVCRAWHSSCR